MIEWAVYAGSFDPFTFGHFAIAEAARKMVKNVVIAVGRNSSKKSGLFDTEQRLSAAKSYWPRRPKGLQFTAFSGLLTDFCDEWAHKERVVIVRGLRMVSDFESEMTIAAANRKLSGIQTVFIPTLPDVAFVSSSVVKEIARYAKKKEPLLEYVNAEVAEMLRYQMSLDNLSPRLKQRVSGGRGRPEGA